VIYLDHAATGPLRTEAFESMQPFLKSNFGNPSGHYEIGKTAQKAVDLARTSVAECLGARPQEILFTSGGTESINSALLGISQAMHRAGSGKHIITSSIEHHAGLHACSWLEELGFSVTYLDCDSSGVISANTVKKALQPDTILVSIMLANNEVGSTQPIAEISELLKITSTQQGHRILLHTDAVQAPEWLPVNINQLGVDALSLSAHKFGGPKGMGILFLKRATPFRPLLVGGGQEMQKRAGTENVAGIVGTATALKFASKGAVSRSKRVRKLRQQLREGIETNIDGIHINGSDDNILPNILNVSFEEIESDELVVRLDQEGIATSTGSACSSALWEPSHVLLAMGVPIRRAAGSIRFSLGDHTTAQDIEKVLKVLPEQIKLARLKPIESEITNR
jgi:cysteine desulfurase